MPTAPINGTTLYYTIVGDGLPCLVMHGGLGLDHHEVTPWLDPLGDSLQLIYYDHRGNGASGRPPRETLTHAQFADDAAALASHLGHERVAVLGFSYGGFIALEFALRHPGRLSHLLLMGTEPALTPPEEVLANARRRGATEAQLAILEAGEEPDEEPASDAALGERIGALWPVYFHAYRPEYARVLENVVYSVQGEPPAAETAAYDVTARLGEITAATLILAGRSDFICPPSQAETMARGIPGAELHMFEKSGHLPYVEEPEATFAAVRDWLARHR
ncbi:MAG: alpha/beta fold hydrolase [Deinococcales bacterium]